MTPKFERGDLQHIFCSLAPTMSIITDHEKGPAFPVPVPASDTNQASTHNQQARTANYQEPGVAAPNVHGSKIADPRILGFLAFATTLLLWSLFNLQTRRISHPNVIVGMAIFCGGLAMILAGVWAFPRGQALYATAFTMFGTFWLSYALMLIPGTGILAAFVNESEFRSALGIYFLVWGLVAAFLAIIGVENVRAHWPSMVFHFLLAVTFWVLAGGVFAGSTAVIKGGGVLGCITGSIAYLVAITYAFRYESQYLQRS